ncbi:MAG: sterol desaturase family protein [Paucibacter sp.]|nr:sterol desaturase family protein [Roseateles sp.]
MPTAIRSLNWPHLLLLLALWPYAALTAEAGWSPDLVLGGGTLGALLWLMLWERLLPLRQQWQARPAELKRDGAFLGINAVADAAAGFVLTGLALYGANLQPEAGLAAGLPPLLALPLAIALGELGPFALHRLAHRRPWAWRIHELHHRPTKLNAANSVLAHPLNVIWNKLARVLPWLLLGFDQTTMLWAALFMQVQGIAVHANIRGSLGPLDRLIGSAELHRWHHSVIEAEAHNYGTAIPLWDQLFGSYVRRPGEQPRTVGIFGGQVRAAKARDP